LPSLGLPVEIWHAAPLVGTLNSLPRLSCLQKEARHLGVTLPASCGEPERDDWRRERQALLEVSQTCCRGLLHWHPL
jgi:hypothetical protein